MKSQVRPHLENTAPLHTLVLGALKTPYFNPQNFKTVFQNKNYIPREHLTACEARKAPAQKKRSLTKQTNQQPASEMTDSFSPTFGLEPKNLFSSDKRYHPIRLKTHILLTGWTDPLIQPFPCFDNLTSHLHGTSLHIFKNWPNEAKKIIRVEAARSIIH